VGHKKAGWPGVSTGPAEASVVSLDSFGLADVNAS
jgi:hypothetical protein